MATVNKCWQWTISGQLLCPAPANYTLCTSARQPGMKTYRDTINKHTNTHVLYMFIHTSVVQIGSFMVVNLWHHVFGLHQPQVVLARHGYRAHAHLSSLHGHLVHTYARHIHVLFESYVRHKETTEMQIRDCKCKKRWINMMNSISNKCKVSPILQATIATFMGNTRWWKILLLVCVCYLK